MYSLSRARLERMISRQLAAGVFKVFVHVFSYGRTLSYGGKYSIPLPYHVPCEVPHFAGGNDECFAPATWVIDRPSGLRILTISQRSIDID